MLKGERGSVTIYSIVIIVPLFMFQAVLVDFVRIRMASVESEQALRAAARSVLSAFDKELNHYGLFGVKASSDEQRAIANDVLNKYGTGNEKSDTFPWLVLNVNNDRTLVNHVYSLADHRLLHHQILEDMKIKAPVEFTRHAYNKWKGKQPEITKTEEEMQLAERTDRLLKEREQWLREAFGYAVKMNERMQEAFNRYQDNLTEADAREKLADVAHTDFQFFQNKLIQITEKLNEAEKAEQKLLDDADIQANDLFNNIYILGHEFYLKYKTDCSIAVSLFGAFSNMINSDRTHTDLFESNYRYYNFFKEWFTARFADENQRVSAYENLEKQKQDQRMKTKKQLDRAKFSMKGLVCSDSNAADYQRVMDNYHKYMQVNESIDRLEPDPAYSLEQNAEQYQGQAMSFLSGLANTVEKIRDEVYVNEYAMYYFNHGTSSLSPHRGPMKADPNEHALKGQEVEFVLYGLSSCSANKAAAYAEIYMIRFSVRMLEALTDVRKAAAGSPLLMVLTAAAEGALKAYQDMELLTRGEQLAVFAKWGDIKMGYADYLRMFLAVHSQEDKKLSRIQALIELNTGIDLQQRPAYIEVKSTASIRLWFLPAAAKLVNPTIYARGNVNGRVYDMEKMAAMSY